MNSKTTHKALYAIRVALVVAVLSLAAVLACPAPAAFAEPETGTIEEIAPNGDDVNADTGDEDTPVDSIALENEVQVQPVENAVAQINHDVNGTMTGTQYSDFSNALKSLSDGDELVLLDDVTWSSTKLSSKKDCTLNLATHTISGNGTASLTSGCSMDIVGPGRIDSLTISTSAGENELTTKNDVEFGYLKVSKSMSGVISKTNVTIESKVQKLELFQTLELNVTINGTIDELKLTHSTDTVTTTGGPNLSIGKITYTPPMAKKTNDFTNPRVATDDIVVISDVPQSQINLEQAVWIVPGGNENTALTWYPSNGGDNRDYKYIVQFDIVDDATIGKKNLVLHKNNLQDPVYLDPVNGNDGQNGYDPDNSVKTLSKALSILAPSKGNTILLLNTLTITEDTDLYNLIIQRCVDSESGDGPKGEMIVVENCVCNLNNVRIDGGNQVKVPSENTVSITYFKANAAMIHVKGSGTLNINEGTVLENNTNEYPGGSTPIFAISGGAIYNEGTVNMYGGKIANNKAVYGGGVFTKSQFNMYDGEIENNSASGLALNGGTKASSGGGVMVATSSGIMNFSGGTISKNTAWTGGGIALGCRDNNTQSSSKLFMTGGTIDRNEANGNGGGLYVQANVKPNKGSEAHITAGYITNNCAKGESSDLQGVYYPGGGIYVNGSNGWNSGKLYLENVEIAYNTAEAFGGAIAACPSSNVRIYLNNGGIMHDNNARMENPPGMGSTVSVEATSWNTVGGHIGQPNVVLSAYMLGGAAYDWYGLARHSNPSGGYIYDEECHKLDVNEYGSVKLPNAESNLYCFFTDASSEGDKAADIANGVRLAQVHITGNYTTQCSGGGIGTNGDVYIGTSDAVLRLQKLVNAKDNQDHTKDEFEFTVSFVDKPGKVTLMRNGQVESDDLEFVQQENGSWTTTIPMKANDVVLLYGKALQTGMEYTVTETKTCGADSTKAAYTESSQGKAEVQGVTVSGVLSPKPADFNDKLYNEDNPYVIPTSVVFTNTFEPDTPPPPSYPRTGSLVVTKTVTGSGDQTERFHFRVELSNKSINGKYGDMTFADGVAEFDLAHGERSTARGLPAGVTHTVTESDYSGEGYVQSATGDSGTITAGGTRTAAFTNHRGELGSLTITKAVTGGDESFEGKEFTFTVSGPDGFSRQVTLRDGESATLDDLQPGTYTVVEDETGAVVAGWDLSPFYDGLDENNSVEVLAGRNSQVDVTNSYERTPLGGSGTLTINKRVQGGGDEARSKTYTFDVYDRRTGERVATATIVGEGTATVDDLPVGEYFVVERDAAIDGLTWEAEVTAGGIFTIVPDGEASVDVTNVYGPGEPEEETEIPDGPTPTTPGPRFPTTTYPVPTLPPATTTTIPSDTVEITDDAVPLGYLPKTGDPTNLVLVASVAGIAVAAMALGAMLLKKEEGR